MFLIFDVYIFETDMAQFASVLQITVNFILVTISLHWQDKTQRRIPPQHTVSNFSHRVTVQN